MIFFQQFEYIVSLMSKLAFFFQLSEFLNKIITWLNGKFNIIYILPQEITIKIKISNQ